MRLSLKVVLSAIVFCLGNNAIAQEEARPACQHMKSHMQHKVTVADVGEDNYDVKYVKLDVTVTNTSTHIAGNATTTAVVTAPLMSAYVFELSSLLTIDSVLIDGVSATFSSSGVVRTATLPSSLTAGTAFTAQVFYRGTPTSGTLFGGSLGMNCIASPSWGNRATYTLSESYHANEWWPCKQSLRDKIDSLDMWITVPDSLKAGSNGVLSNITSVAPGYNRFEWKERYPIDYYLVSLAVANYVDYSYYAHYTGSTDSTLVQNYVYSNPGTLPFFKSVIDSTGLMLDFFSRLYGRYPFWREKYGHCMGPLGGGMEHQTMTTLGSFSGTLVAHELGHQWFGDNVTCGTWADIFMNEGFASYSEYLFIDHFHNHTAALQDIQDQQTNVKSQPDGAIYVDDTTSEGRIFDGRLSYDKGSCLLHMLRFVVNDDTTFFHVLQAHQQNMHGSTATIADLENETIAITGPNVLGMSIDTFFMEWAYGQGYPLYTVTWNQSGSDVWVKLVQTTTMASSVSLFLTPIELKLHSAAMDTTIRVFNNQSSQVYHFTWNRTMTDMVLDPNYWLVYTTNSITKDNSLDVNNAATASISITPNPATTVWCIDNLPAGSKVILNDMSGRTLWEKTADKNISVPAEGLGAGMYIIRVIGAEGHKSFKVVKE